MNKQNPVLSSLSKRGEKAAHTVMRVDLEYWAKALENQFDPDTNPTGVFPLNVAENRLIWPYVRPYLEAATKGTLPDWVAAYTSPRAHPKFCKEVALFLEKYVTHSPIDPDFLAFGPGATGIIEMTSFLLTDAGEVAAIPAPAYPVYEGDMGNIPGVLRYNIQTHQHLQELQEGPLLSSQHLEAAQRQISREGKSLRMIILTTPDNPTGMMYTEDQLREIAAWCMNQKVHLIVNEIYRQSTLNLQHPDLRADYNSTEPIGSFAAVMHQHQSEYLHFWYAFSKDFGLSGLRTGMIFSYNKELIRAFENINLSHSVSNHTQWVLINLLAQPDFAATVFQKNQELLTRSYAAVISLLRKYDVPYVPARGSLFVWFDLSVLMPQQDREHENKLWLDIYHESGILLTPGDGFGHARFGCFRMVYSYVSYDHLCIALNRLDQYLNSRIG